MKSILLAALAVVTAAGVTPVAPVARADAQTVVRERTVVRTTRHNGYRPHRWRQVCRTRYHHGRRIRTCRRVRW